MKKKLTKNQTEYRKQINRIKRAYREAEKMGIFFTEKKIPELKNRVYRKDIEALKKIKPRMIRESGYYQNEFLDTAVTGRDLTAAIRQYKKKEKTLHYYEQLIRGYKKGINIYAGSKLMTYIFNWIDRIVADRGAEDVGKMLLEAEKNGVIFTRTEAYSMDNLKNYVVSLLDYLPEAYKMESQYYSELIEEMEKLEEWAE